MIENGPMKKTNKKELEKLEQELTDLKESNKSLWDRYGSELCAGEMIAEETALQKKIEKLKITEKWREAGLLDENDNPIPSTPKPLTKNDE